MNIEYKGEKKLLLGLSLAIVTHWMLTQSLMVTIPHIKLDVLITDSWANWSVGLSGLIAGCLLILTGSLADHFGRMKFVRSGLIFNIMGCLFLLGSKEQSLFLFGRILQGLGAAFILSSTLAIAKTYFEGLKRQRAISFVVMSSFASTALCTFVGGWLSFYLGWKSIFMISIMISVVSFLLMMSVPETTKKEEKYPWDVTGIIVFLCLMISLNIVTTKMSLLSIQWIISFFMIFFFVAWIFIKAQAKKGSKALLDVSIFRIKAYKTAFIVNCIVNLGVGFIVVSNLYLQQGRGLNTMQVGLLSLGHGIGVLIFVRIGEKLLQKYGLKLPATLGLLIATLGFLLSAVFVKQGDLPYLAITIITFLLLGVGLGLQATPTNFNAMNSVPLSKASISGAMIQGGSALASSFGIAICISLYSYIARISTVHIAAQVTFSLTTLFYGLGFIYILYSYPSKQKLN